MPTTRSRKAVGERKPVEYPKPTTDPEALAEAAAPDPDVFAEAVTVVDDEPYIQPPALKSTMPSDAAGTYALATMADEEFSQRLAILKRGRDRIAQIQRELMEVDVDYGLIPGTPKPTLFKPGAEKLALIYGLAARIENEFVGGDGERQPLLKYESACFLHLGSFDGPVVAVGHGTANGWEKRYRRESDKACPNCGKQAIIRSKAEYGGGWYCFPRKDGCGSKFPAGDPAIDDQVTDARGDPVLANDLQNTLLKMSEKRAFVDAVLRATASSGLFTQDVAEEPDPSLVDNSPRISPRGAVDVDPGPYDAQDEPAEVRTSDVGVVERGGHRPEVTDAQIAAARQLAKTAGFTTPWMMADEIADVLGGGIDSTELPEDRAEAATVLLTFMKSMSPDDMGKVITHLRKKGEAKE